MRILGLSAFYHDSAAALVVDGQVAAAAQEERFTRKKHDDRFPAHAIGYCLRQAGLSAADLDAVVFYEKPFTKFERLLETYLAFAPRGFQSFRSAMPLWLRGKLFQKYHLIKELRKLSPAFDSVKLLFAEHHLSHAASAFYPSPFKNAAVLVLDGVGEWATVSTGNGCGRELVLEKELQFPHSLGLLYSAFTFYLGFKVNSGEYKVMGLAPYGSPRYAQEIFDQMIDLKVDGSFQLNLEYFDFCTGLRMTSQRFHDFFGAPPRDPDAALLPFHMDLAASIQAVTEEVVLRQARCLASNTGQQNLCLAGGVALNCVANSKILGDGCFQRIWVQPAAGDAGGALGAALYAYYGLSGEQRHLSGDDGMRGALLGPDYAQHEIERQLQQLGAVYQVLNADCLTQQVASALATGKVAGWFQGQMEYGPRALGNRSILADPRAPGMQSLLNQKIKFRESFRPFAPAVLREDLEEWFELAVDSPYMLFVGQVSSRHFRPLEPDFAAVDGFERLKHSGSEIPAVTHVDGSARIQTVHQETNPRFHALLRAFKQQTGCPVLANTSFNVRGEPIVCSPEDAYGCFMGTHIDLLAIGNCLLLKKDQPQKNITLGSRSFAPD